MSSGCAFKEHGTGAPKEHYSTDEYSMRLIQCGLLPQRRSLDYRKCGESSGTTEMVRLLHWWRVFLFSTIPVTAYGTMLTAQFYERNREMNALTYLVFPGFEMISSTGNICGPETPSRSFSTGTRIFEFRFLMSVPLFVGLMTVLQRSCAMGQNTGSDAGPLKEYSETPTPWKDEATRNTWSAYYTKKQDLRKVDTTGINPDERALGDPAPNCCDFSTKSSGYKILQSCAACDFSSTDKM